MQLIITLKQVNEELQKEFEETMEVPLENLLTLENPPKRVWDYVKQKAAEVMMNEEFEKRKNFDGQNMADAYLDGIEKGIEFFYKLNK